jgi:uncharacterized protein YndB with AHSA1/START domain
MTGSGTRTGSGPAGMAFPGERAVTETRRINAPAETLFALLADPAAHPQIDGTGLVRAALSPGRLTGVGDTFTIAMHNDEMGPYEMTNQVVAFEPDRLIAWEPRLTKASRPEDRAEIGGHPRHVWGYRLEPTGDGATEVTEFFDCSRSPEWLQAAVRGGQGWVEAIRASLANLDRAAAVTSAAEPPR